MHEEKETTDSAHDAEASPASPREEQSNMMMDDINIPMVATSVAFFGVLLAVTIISLQAWFYNYQAAERRSKTLPQESPLSPLGAMLETQRKELTDPPGEARKLAAAAASAPATGTAPGTATGTGTAPRTATATATATAPKRYRMPIETAMQNVINDYAQGAR